MKLFLSTLILLTLCVATSFAQVPPVQTASTGEFAYSQALAATTVGRIDKYGVHVAVTNVAPAAGTFTCATTDICTKTAHGYKTGLKIQASTTTTLPAGLSPTTDYYVIYLSANTFSLAASLADALVPTAIDITDTGTGTHTITPTSLAGATLKLQGSMDGTNYADLPIKASGDVTKSGTITATANFYLWSDYPMNYVRVYYTLTAGQLSISEVAKVRP